MQKYFAKHCEKLLHLLTIGEYGRTSVYDLFEDLNVSLTNDVVSFEQLGQDV